MDFSLSDEQMLLQAEIDKAMLRGSPLARVREHAAAGGAPAEDIWKVTSELGLPGLIVAPEHCGSGLGMLDAALVAEVLGRHVVPVPFLSSILVPHLLASHTSSAVQVELLPEIAAGRRRFALGLVEAVSGRREGARLEHVQGKLFGDLSFAIDHAGADGIIVVDRSLQLFLVPMDAAGLKVVALDTIDRTRSAALLHFEGVAAEPIGRLTPQDLRRAGDNVRLLLAADLLGAAQAMLDRAVAHARLREQFGRPIGSFQAVKHMCAEMAAELEPCRALIWYAGYAVDQDLEDAGISCLHAKAMTSDAARFVARTATEVHGGMGITDELGLHYWFKRIGWNFQLFGSPERLREEAAMRQGLVSAPCQAAAQDA